MSVAKTGGNNPNYGSERKEETKKKIGVAMKGILRSPETKAKMSEAKRGNNYAAGNTNTAKPVSVYLLDGALVGHFSSATEAATILEVTQQNICKAIKHGYTVKKMYRVQYTTQ
jgi:hypothetical protein